VRQATTLPLIVNGDIVCAATAREAMARSGADAVMIGRGVYGRPWMIAGLEVGLASGKEPPEPDAETRYGVVMDHMEASMAFYGERHGLRVFRKHLGWYIDQAPWPVSALTRCRLCSLELDRLSTTTTRNPAVTNSRTV
jgi:tRNA-dihydrouridine synthase